MHLSRLLIFTAVCLFGIVGLLVVSCSDDDKSVTPTPQWSWSSLGSGMDNHVSALTVYDNQLIVGGYFNEAGGTEANHIAAWGTQ